MSLSGPFDDARIFPEIAHLQGDIARMEAAVVLIERRNALRAKLESEGVDYTALPLSMREIVESVARAHRLSPQALYLPCRSRYVAWPRQEAFWRLRQVKGHNGAPRWSLPHIGRHFGVDHTTVLHGIKAHAKRIAG